MVYEKIKRMILNEDTLITTDELRGITAPTLIMASDDNLFRLEHSLEIYRSIPNAQLAIVPGTSHALVMEKPDVIDGLILEFLTRDPMPTMMPIRRAPAGPPL